jgi:hypothetical protein
MTNADAGAVEGTTISNGIDDSAQSVSALKASAVITDPEHSRWPVTA